ncbi:SURF1 family protein [Janthinobacterium sp. CG_23.3]|uniref:SURF1 family protein n=1 Tax=Janthinobacterium sp. CG_23.3 TaxID=3349634 RepID=UPI0038D44A73
MTGPAATPAGPGARARPRPAFLRIVLALLAGLACAGLLALGTWQLQRLQWKLALIERVEQRVRAAPAPAPGPERWSQVTAASDEYRRVRVAGALLHGLSVRVQATTGLGAGFWLLTPLCGADGNIVLINRGFIAPRAGERPVAAQTPAPAVCDPASAAGEPVVVTGLLRISEPGGAFLRQNDAAGNRWHSRDVAAIAAARQLARVAPYFIDADAKSAAGAGRERPVGGLTVIAFQNNHLVYALTWYALAMMLVGACVWVVRLERRRNAILE